MPSPRLPSGIAVIKSSAYLNRKRELKLKTWDVIFEKVVYDT